MWAQAGKEPAFHLALGPQNALFGLAMLFLGLASGIYLGRSRLDCTAGPLHDAGFTGIAAAGVAAVGGVAVACSQLIGWCICCAAVSHSFCRTCASICLLIVGMGLCL